MSFSLSNYRINSMNFYYVSLITLSLHRHLITVRKNVEFLSKFSFPLLTSSPYKNRDNKKVSFRSHDGTIISERTDWMCFVSSSYSHRIHFTSARLSFGRRNTRAFLWKKTFISPLNVLKFIHRFASGIFSMKAPKRRAFKYPKSWN